MPSIIPSYIYTLFASIIVGTLIITACGLSSANVKSEAEKQQLANIAEYVATKSLELASNAPADNLTLTSTLDIPALIGSQRYWIQITNDSQQSWVQVGFGTAALSSAQQLNMPFFVKASGVYISGSGPALLQYHSDTAGDYLSLYGGS